MLFRFFIIFLIFLFSSPVWAENWLFLEQRAGGINIYIDKDSIIHRNDNFVIFSILSSLPAKGEDVGSEFIQFFEIDCSNRYLYPRNISVYDKNFKFIRNDNLSLTENEPIRLYPRTFMWIVGTPLCGWETQLN